MTVAVGLVLVSHSEEMAEGLREVLAELAAEVPVAAAAGGPEGVLGTNALAIAGAVESLAGQAAGVVVLADLGSAVLSAETALEQLDPALAARVSLADAPFVEGAAAAARAAAGGAELDAVVAAAEAAWGAPRP